MGIYREREREKEYWKGVRISEEAAGVTEGEPETVGVVLGSAGADVADKFGTALAGTLRHGKKGCNITSKVYPSKGG
jgi:hypothetical protein